MPEILLLRGKKFQKNIKHKQRRMFTAVDQLPPAARKLLDESWASTFYEEYFCKIDENILGTQTLMDVAKSFWTNGKEFVVEGREVMPKAFGSEFFTEETSLKPRSPYAIDPTKTVNELGFYLETPFTVGIRKTIQWYLDNQDWVNEVASGDYQKYYEEMYGNR